MITTVIFDLDQTLVDRDATFKHFIEGQFKRFRTQLGNTDIQKFYNTIKRYDNNGYSAKDEVYKNLCNDLNANTKLAITLFDDFKEHYGFEPVLFEGVHATLSELQKSYTLAVITNGRTTGQNAKIDNANLREYFKCIIVSETEGIKKPDLKIFQRCLERLRIKAENAVYIGDNPENDIKAAQVCGMKAIWKRNQHYEEINFADGIIDNIDEIQKALSEL